MKCIINISGCGACVDCGKWMEGTDPLTSLDSVATQTGMSIPVRILLEQLSNTGSDVPSSQVQPSQGEVDMQDLWTYMLH